MTARSGTQTPRKFSIGCMASGGCMCSTDYLVICGRAFAHPMDPADASVESTRDRRKQIIAQLLCLMQRSLMPEFQVSASSVHQSGFDSRRAEDNSLASVLVEEILELAGASSASTAIRSQTRTICLFCAAVIQNRNANIRGRAIIAVLPGVQQSRFLRQAR
jgi:hypothetical protein